MLRQIERVFTQPLGKADITAILRSPTGVVLIDAASDCERRRHVFPLAAFRLSDFKAADVSPVGPVPLAANIRCVAIGPTARLQNGPWVVRFIPEDDLSKCSDIIALSRQGGVGGRDIQVSNGT